MKNVILIGPVSGNVEKAKKVFSIAEVCLHKMGHLVVHNPMRNHVAGKSEAEYMKASLSKICNLVNTDNLVAVLLPNWKMSNGAFCEAVLCKKLGIKTRTWKDLPFKIACAIYVMANQKG